jgi:GxxExxY protein
MEIPFPTSTQSAQSAQSVSREQLDQTSRIIIAAAIDVHSKLGPGLLESVYQTCTAHYLRKSEQDVKTEVSLPVIYLGTKLDPGYRVDILVNNCVIVEIKAIEQIAPIHLAQLLSYLRLSNLRLGLLINFNVKRLVTGIRRVVNNY